VENLEPVIHPVQHPSLSAGEVVESRKADAPLLVLCCF
jgi:hypothetical protein